MSVIPAPHAGAGLRIKQLARVAMGRRCETRMNSNFARVFVVASEVGVQYF